MTVKYTEDQMALIKDALNNARQVAVWLQDWTDGELVTKCAEGISNRLDTLSDIIDNGIVEDVHE